MHHQQTDPSKAWMLSPWGKGDIPRRCFPNSNLRQECCTALLSVLCSKSGPTDLNRDCSVDNQSKTHLLILSLSFGPTQGCHKSVTVMQVISYTLITGHRPLSTLIRLSGPCCLVLQSSWVGNTLSVAAQANKCHKNHEA